MNPSRHLLPVVLLAAAATAQGPGPADAEAKGAQKPSASAAPEDPGVPVEMFENQNLDRFVRKARDFLARKDFAGAIQVLQDVIEGKTVEAVDSSAEGEPATGAPAAPAKAPEPRAAPPKQDEKAKPDEQPKDAKAEAKVEAKVEAQAGAEAKPATEKAPAAEATPAAPARAVVATVQAQVVVVGKAMPAAGGAGVATSPVPNLQTAPLDAAKAVYSEDKRMYRPVRRLCHEMLASMPAEGIELYRTTHEVAAERQLAEAQQDGTLAALEAVANRYFVTLAGGRALALVADRLLWEGRARAAVQVLRDLLDVYPETLRRQLGMKDEWLRFRIALALQLAGEGAQAVAAAEDLARRAPGESLRVEGELVSIDGLAAAEWLRAGAAEPVAVDSQPALLGELEASKPGAWAGVAATEVGSLLPQLTVLWRHRFVAPRPYQQPSRRNQNERFIVVSEGSVLNASPPAWKHGIGPSVSFRGKGLGSEAVFFDHFRLREASAFSGVVLREADGPLEPPKPRDGQPRVRVPAYDFGTMRAVDDDVRTYAILGWSGSSTTTVNVLTENQLVAHDCQTLQRVWSTRDTAETGQGKGSNAAAYKGVTFLAAPTVFGDKLLVPVLRNGAYSLQAMSAAHGRPLWCTPIHGGGSPFTKAPGTPCTVLGGTAYVLTNAGCLAAVDAQTGDLQWVRRYERVDPYRVRPRTRTSDRPAERNFGQQFVETDLPSHLPSDLLLVDGLLVFAPCDGDAALCLDAATGAVKWMLDSSSRLLPYGRLQYLVGADDQLVFFASETDLLCVELRSGVQLWSKQVPPEESLGKWRGRGVVHNGFVLLPGQRELLALDTRWTPELAQRARDAAAGPDQGAGPEGTTVSLHTPASDWLRMPLPAPTVGEEPLRGPSNLTVSGPWLGVSYESGIEVYSSQSALRALAQTASPVDAALCLALAGDVDAALGALERQLAVQPEDGTAATQLLVLARQQSMASARAGDRSAALAVLQRVRPRMEFRRELLLDWHVSRIGVFQMLQDLAALAAEQQQLYRLMEGTR